MESNEKSILQSRNFTSLNEIPGENAMISLQRYWGIRSTQLLIHPDRSLQVPQALQPVFLCNPYLTIINEYVSKTILYI